MADIKDSSFDSISTTTDMQVTGLAPDGGSPTGLKNIRIDITDFFSTLWTQININTAAIAALLARVVILENSSSKTYEAATGTFTYSQPADSLITLFTFTTITGTPTVKVGTAAGLDDIISSKAITGGFRSISSNIHTTTLRTLYVTITGGTCDVVTFRKLNLNS